MSVPATCPACDTPVISAVLPSGQRIALNPDPDPDGWIRVDPVPWHVDRWAVVLPFFVLQVAREAGEDLYVSHFATCPDAGQHRRGKENR